MICEYFGLGIWHIIFASLFIRPEHEIRKTELRKKPRCNGFSILYAYILFCHNTRCRIISHKTRGILSLLAPEYAIYRKQSKWDLSVIAHFTQTDKPARCHVASKSIMRRNWNKRLKFREHMVDHDCNFRICNLQSCSHFGNKVIPFYLPFLIGMKDQPY